MMFKKIESATKLRSDAQDIARATVKGRRNQAEAEVGIARQLVDFIDCLTEIQPGDIVVRYVGKELGCKRYSDRRNCLDLVCVDKITDKLCIGSIGERVPFDHIIAVQRGEEAAS